MEEKERFEVHIYDDVCVDLYNNGVLDKSINDTYKLEKLLNQQDREINRLTKMLYTTTKHADKLNEENNKLNKIIKANIISADKVVKENQQLKQQLAEKEKEIEQLKKFDDLNKTFFELFRTAFKEPDKVDDLFNTLKTIQEKHNQDKISFAVEQLGKIKRYIDDNAYYIDEINFGEEINEYIDNQIKELKGDK